LEKVTEAYLFIILVRLPKIIVKEECFPI